MKPPLRWPPLAAVPTLLLGWARRALLLLAALAFGTAARAGTFSTAAWTNDASTGINPGRTLWAYHFGATTPPATINGVSVTGLAGPNASNANFDLTGMTNVSNADTNNVTATGGGSAVMAHDFVYGGTPATVTVKGLTVGRNYVVSFFSVGWQSDFGNPNFRLVTFSSGTDSQQVQQLQFGPDNGIRVDYAFTATATTRVITIAVANANNATFHLYGLALQRPPAVTNTNDGGAGSLRQALLDAASYVGADTVMFDAGLNGGTITLLSEIVSDDASGAVSIDASTLPAGLTIDGGPNANRILSVSAGRNVSLLGLTLTGGNGDGAAQNGNGGAIVNFGTLALTRCTLSGNGNASGSGGAILNDGGTLTLTQCTLSGNSTTNGGAIFQTTGTATLTQCTFSGNAAVVDGDGGAIYKQAGSMTATHCTFSGNQATGGVGGAITQIDGTTTLTHCTVAGNQAANFGGGFYQLNDALSTLTNTIVAGNTAGIGSPDIHNDGTITPTGVNFIGDPSGSQFTAGPIIRTTAANGPINLTPLGSNGGPTQTMVPRRHSPAIDVSSFVSGLTTDQRGFPRPLENGPTGEYPDIGAVEVQTILVTTAADQLDTPRGAQTSLREALRDGADRVAFSPGLASQTILLGSQLEVAKYAAIDASNIATGMTVSGNNTSRVFHIAPGVSADLEYITITGGRASGGFPSGYGGGFFNEGALSLTECTVSGNSATTAGGGIYTANSVTASLDLIRSTVSGNTSQYGGGIQNEGTLVAQSSTFAENTASVEGGAIGAPFAKPVTLRHCTISTNNAGTGGGTAGNAITLDNSIVSGNTPTDYSGGLTLSGSSVVVTDALLAPLGNYGGPTQTMALKPGSPARDLASSSTVDSDQRGFPIVGQRDIGAYEAGTFTNYNAYIWETLPANAIEEEYDADHDYDGDGQSNFDEWLAGTEAANAGSVFRASNLTRNGNLFTITFSSVSGRSYKVQFSTDLIGWMDLSSPINGTGNPIAYGVSVDPEIPKIFFRVRLLP